MATYTTNLNLKKPAQSDKIRIADINNNMDDIDAAFGAVGNDSVATQIGNLQGALAIVAVGDSHAAVTAGQFVYVRSHETLDAGLYVASSNIAENGALSLSNLTADSSGGLNALNSNLAPLIEPVSSPFTAINVLNCDSWNGSMYKRIGNIVYIRFSVKNLTANSNIIIANLPQEATPVLDVEFDGFGGIAFLNHAHFKITEAGAVNVYSADTYATGWVSYPGK